MNAPRRNLAAVGRWGTARKAASRSGSTRKTDSLAGIREAARRAHQVRSPGSKGGSTSKAWPRAKFAMVVLEAGSRARVCDNVHEGQFAKQTARRLRKAGSRSSSTSKADKAQKSAAPKNGALPRKTTGANQIRLES